MTQDPYPDPVVRELQNLLRDCTPEQIDAALSVVPKRERTIYDDRTALGARPVAVHWQDLVQIVEAHPGLLRRPAALRQRLESKGAMSLAELLVWQLGVPVYGLPDAEPPAVAAGASGQRIDSTKGFVSSEDLREAVRAVFGDKAVGGDLTITAPNWMWEALADRLEGTDR